MAIEPTTGVDWEAFVKQFQTLKGAVVTPSASSVTGGVYDIPKLQTDLETTRTKLQTAEDALKGYQSKRYDEEYSNAGLETIKSKVADIDSQIASEKAKRDESISKVRKNPYYSAANITGESAEIEKLANANINNLVDQRNSSAEQYKAALGEVTKKVAIETQDKQTEIEGLRYDLNWMTNQLGTYQTIRSQELATSKGEEQWAMDFAAKLQEIETSKTQWEKTYELEKYKAEQPTERALQYIKDATGNVIGYFDPSTGKTQYYTPEEMPTAPTAMTFAERDFRSKVADKIKAGESLESMRDNPETAGIVIKPPSSKTATQIVEEEWAKAHPTGWWGKFVKWLPGGY